MLVTNRFPTMAVRCLVVGGAITILASCSSRDLAGSGSEPAGNSATTTSTSVATVGPKGGSTVAVTSPVTGAQAAMADYISCLRAGGIADTRQNSLSSQQLNTAAAACAAKLPPQYRNQIDAMSRCVDGKLSSPVEKLTTNQRECVKKVAAGMAPSPLSSS